MPQHKITSLLPPRQALSYLLSTHQSESPFSRKREKHSHLRSIPLILLLLPFSPEHPPYVISTLLIMCRYPVRNTTTGYPHIQSKQCPISTFTRSYHTYVRVLASFYHKLHIVYPAQISSYKKSIFYTSKSYSLGAIARAMTGKDMADWNS